MFNFVILSIGIATKNILATFIIVLIVDFGEEVLKNVVFFVLALIINKSITYPFKS